MQRRRYVSRFTESVSFATVSHVELQLLNSAYCLLSPSHRGHQRDTNAQNTFTLWVIHGAVMMMMSPGSMVSIDINDQPIA